MSDDREALLRENQRLLKLSRRWRAVAIGAIALVFVVMLPFTIASKDVINYFSGRDQEKAAKIQAEIALDALKRAIEETDKTLGNDEDSNKELDRLNERLKELRKDIKSDR